MANIYIRGKTIWIHYSVDGKLYRKSTTLKNTKQNLKLARNKCYDIEYMIDNHIMPTDDDVVVKRRVVEKEQSEFFIVTINKLLESYISTETPSDTNTNMYRLAVKKLGEIVDINMPIDSVDEILYNTFKEYLLKNVSYETSRTYINYIRILFNYAIKTERYKKRNPFTRLKRREKKYITVIPEKYFDLILNHLKEKNIDVYRFIFFLKHTGFRLNEGLQLEWEQIKFNEKIISFTTFKDNNSNDIFPLNIENGILIKFLKSFRRESGKVFNTNKWVLKHFQKAITTINTEQKKLNKKFKEIPRYTIHDIRRTFGSKYANRLMPIELMKLMRHKEINTTLRFYVNIQMNDIAKKLNRR